MIRRRGVRGGFQGVGLDPERFRGRIIDRDLFLSEVYGSFADLFEPEDPAQRESLASARSTLLGFTQMLMPTYQADKFHVHLAGNLDKVVAGKITNLMVEAPPQHGKSVLVSQMLPGYWLGHHPDLPVLLSSYAATRAYDNSRRARSNVMSPLYARLFGGRTPDPANFRANHWAFEDLPGFTYAAGIGGAVTGLGFGLGIIDDPHESWEQAQSQTYQDRAWEWWTGTFIGRMWENAPIVLITTRWDENDLAGRILEEEGVVEEGGKWVRLRYPALAEEENKELGIPRDILGRKAGEPLAPRRFSKKYLMAVRERVGEMVWTSEYQQRPSKPEGDFFKVNRFEIEEFAPTSICRMEKGEIAEVLSGVRFWDLAATKAETGKRDPDYTSGTLMAEAKEDGRFWVLDRVTGRLGPEQVADLILQTAKVDGKKVRIVIEQEPGASGKALADGYVSMLAGYNVKAVPHSGDKRVWATPWAAQVNAGHCVLLKAPWNKQFMVWHAGFDNAAHDDDVDSAAGAFNDLTTGRKFRAIPFRHA